MATVFNTAGRAIESLQQFHPGTSRKAAASQLLDSIAISQRVGVISRQRSVGTDGHGAGTSASQRDEG